MEDSSQTSAGIPDMTDDILMAAAAVTIPGGPRTFHLFPDLPPELRDLVWDKAARNVYEPLYALTAEKPRLFCIVHDISNAPLVTVLDLRIEFLAASITLREELLALLLASKDSHQQTRRALGCPGEGRRLPLLMPHGRYAYRKNRLFRQMVVLRNDILCLDCCYSWLDKPVGPESDLGELQHVMLSMTKIAAKGPLTVKELLKCTPCLETLYLDVTGIRYNVFGRLVNVIPCSFHHIDFHTTFTWLCDLPPSPLQKHSDEDGFENEDGRSDGSVVDGGSSTDVTKGGLRAVDYNIILGLLGPVELHHFRDIWTMCADAGIKLRVVARSGRHADQYRQ